MKQNILVVGASGHSKVVIDLIEKEGEYNIIGIITALDESFKGTFSGYKILGNEEDLPLLFPNNIEYKLFIAIGDNWIRQKVKNKIVKIVPHIEFATLIHPTSQIGRNVIIGNGVAIMAGVIINCDSIIGNFSIINTKASLDHENIIQDYTSIGPGATTGGNVSIGEFSAISIGATVKHGISIGKHSIIGASALLMKDCGDNFIMYGVPAQVVRVREIGEKYL